MSYLSYFLFVSFFIPRALRGLEPSFIHLHIYNSYIWPRTERVLAKSLVELDENGGKISCRKHISEQGFQENNYSDLKELVMC